MKMIQIASHRLGMTAALGLALSFALVTVGCSSGEKAEDESDVAATTDESATPPAAAAPATPAPEVATMPTTPTVNPMTGGSVLYVKTNATDVKEQPNATARTVGKLQRGDHVYVTVEGAWAKVGDNKCVPTSSLTEQGVGRARSKAQWNGTSK